PHLPARRGGVRHAPRRLSPVPRPAPPDLPEDRRLRPLRSRGRRLHLGAHRPRRRPPRRRRPHRRRLAPEPARPPTHPAAPGERTRCSWTGPPYGGGNPNIEEPGGLGWPTLTPKRRWMIAVLACGPEAVLSHRSAAALLRIGEERRGLTDVTVCSRRR